ncbi:MAG: hypothetical protein LC122_13870 [Chitinophagales bacterium]|nr:hypothetical protein [Chitinophagales bacterium]
MTIDSIAELNDTLSKTEPFVVLGTYGDLDVARSVEKFTSTVKEAFAYKVELSRKIFQFVDNYLSSSNLYNEAKDEYKAVSMDALASAVTPTLTTNIDDISKMKEFVVNLLVANSSTERNKPAKYFWQKKGRNSGIWLWDNKPLVGGL